MTKEEKQNTLNKVAEAFADILWFLYIRWQDEKHYEDFKDYADNMKKNLEALKEKIGIEVKFIKATKRPFGVQLEVTGIRASVTANARSIKWKFI